MEVTDALLRLGGVATRGMLVAATSHHAVRTSIREGRIVRLSRGHYALPGIADATAAAIRVGGVCSHLTAALQWEWAVVRQSGRS